MSSMRSWSAVMQESSTLQVRVQLLQGQSHSAFDRAQRYADHLGDLPMAVAAEVGQLHRLSLLDGQAGQRVVDHVPLDRGRDLAPGVGARAPRLGVDGDLTLLALVGAPAPQVVDRAV